MSAELPKLTPVEAPPASGQGKSNPAISWGGVAGYCAALPGQWFRMEVDLPNPRTAASHAASKYGLDVAVRGGVVFVRAGGDA